MKLILTQEVAGLGAPGDVVEVKDGYGRNYLVPRGFAIRWTKGAEKQIASIKRARDAREIRDVGHAQEVKAQLEALKVTLPARAGDAGRLFGSVTVGDVADAVKAAGGPDVDKRRDRDRHADQDRRRPPGDRPAPRRGRRRPSRWTSSPPDQPYVPRPALARSGAGTAGTISAEARFVPRFSRIGGHFGLLPCYGVRPLPRSAAALRPWVAAPAPEALGKGVLVAVVEGTSTIPFPVGKAEVDRPVAPRRDPRRAERTRPADPAARPGPEELQHLRRLGVQPGRTDQPAAVGTRRPEPPTAAAGSRSGSAVGPRSAYRAAVRHLDDLQPVEEPGGPLRVG